MIIAITGTPGTGKSTLASLLKRHIPAKAIDANRLFVKEKRHSSFDKARKAYLIAPEAFISRIGEEVSAFKEEQEAQALSLEFHQANVLLVGFFRDLEEEPSLFLGKLRTKLAKLALKGRFRRKIKAPLLLIIDSHLSHLLPSDLVDFCLIAQTRLEKLNKRLKKRKYGTLKLSENLEAEAFESSRIDAEEAGHRVIVVHT